MHPPRLPALALMTLSLPLAAQTTYYVDASATPPGQGTQAEPWPQIQTALDHPGLLPGDTILVAPGLYVENLISHVDRITSRAPTGRIERRSVRPRVTRPSPTTPIPTDSSTGQLTWKVSR